MTTREAFEAQIRKQFPTANEELLLGKLLNGRYVSLVTEHAWLAWQAAKATCPAWHDAPTVPGLWMNGINRHAQEVLQRHVDAGMLAEVNGQWFGPIPIPEDRQ